MLLRRAGCPCHRTKSTRVGPRSYGVSSTTTRVRPGSPGRLLLSSSTAPYGVEPCCRRAWHRLNSMAGASSITPSGAGRSSQSSLVRSSGAPSPSMSGAQRTAARRPQSNGLHSYNSPCGSPFASSTSASCLRWSRSAIQARSVPVRQMRSTSATSGLSSRAVPTASAITPANVSRGKSKEVQCMSRPAGHKENT